MLVNVIPQDYGFSGSSVQPRNAGQSRNLVIGLVNLMPLAAAQRTENEFRALLEANIFGAELNLRCFSRFPQNVGGIDRESLDALWDTRMDGLIVTGAEPKANMIADEPLLPALARLIEWGAQNTKSIIFSCFAAHGAIWCLDKIPRERLGRKLSGLFVCQKSSDHPMMAGMPETWLVPHSRHNTLNKAALRDAGYHILSDGPRLGADMFLKPHGDSQFVFWQGHPEYGAEVLLSEYCRDLKRFMNGSNPHPPHWPEQYMEAAGQHVTELLSHANKTCGVENMAAELQRIKGGPDHSWRGPASRIMGGWLRSLTQPATEHAASSV